MKIYVKTNGITLVGKPWQIKYLLNNYMKQFHTVQEWIDATLQNESRVARCHFAK